MESILLLAASLPREVILVMVVVVMAPFAAALLRRPAAMPTRVSPRPAMERRTRVGNGSAPRPRYAGSGPDWSSIVMRRPLPGGVGSAKPNPGATVQARRGA